MPKGHNTITYASCLDDEGLPNEQKKNDEQNSIKLILVPIQFNDFHLTEH